MESFGRVKKFSRNEGFLEMACKLYQGGVTPNVNNVYFERAKIDFLLNRNEHDHAAIIRFQAEGDVGGYLEEVAVGEFQEEVGDVGVNYYVFIVNFCFPLCFFLPFVHYLPLCF